MKQRHRVLDKVNCAKMFVLKDKQERLQMRHCLFTYVQIQIGFCVVARD